MTKDGFKFIVLLVVLTLLPLSAHAVIEEKSSIIGSILGNADLPIPGVQVRLLDSFFLSEVAKTITDKEGKFHLTNVLPGLYLISIGSPAASQMLKRIEVISGHPTVIDLRSVLDQQQLKEHDAWDKFKWTIRVADRNPLRQQELPKMEEPITADYSADSFFAYLRNIKETRNIRGHVSYLSSSPSNSSWTQQATEIAMAGEMPEHGEWSFNGNYVDGARSSYVASGDVQYRIATHQVGASFSANDLLLAYYPTQLPIRKWTASVTAADLAGENKQWVSSVDLQDEWQLFRRLSIDYGTRIDYYGYLEQPLIYSPRVETSYQITPVFAVRGLYFMDQSAPGNFSMQPSDNEHPFIHDVAFVPYQEGLNPERKVGYQAGVDFQKNDYRFSVFYHTEQVSDKIAAVDLRNSLLTDVLQTNRPFVIFNAKDLDSQGIGARFIKQIAPDVMATVSYTMSEATPVYIIEKRGLTGRQLYFMESTDPQAFHDLEAGIEAHIRQSKTDLHAEWRWSSGTPLVFGNQNENRALSAVDIEVHQAVPVHFLSQSELKILLTIRNLLDQNPDAFNNADFERALLFNLPRTVAGGVLWQF